MCEELVAMRCVCNHAIAVLLLDAGEQLCTITFFDGEPTSDTYDERVRECPACSEQLGLHWLLRVADPKGKAR